MDYKINNDNEQKKALIVDVIAGDETTANREDFKILEKSELYTSINAIINNPLLTSESKTYILNNTWRVIYKQKPPKDISDFLTSTWLGSVSDNIYPHVREELIEFFDPTKAYRKHFMASCIGAGKSFQTSISILYILTNLAIMRNPKKVFRVNTASSIVAVLGSFTQDKATQLLLGPLYNIVKSSPKFRNVRMSERISPTQDDEYKSGSNKIVWTSASRLKGKMELSNDLHVLLVSDFSNLLGLSIICGALSELSWFLERGISPDAIERFRTDLESRIYSRFDNNYWARSIIDSSPYDSEKSPIDKYIFSGLAAQDPQNYITNTRQWDLFSDKYPIWEKTKETFPVFKGTSGKPPKLLTLNEIGEYRSDDIVDVPIDIKKFFTETTLVKSLKDFAAVPAGSEDKLITDFKLIDNMFYKHLPNEYDAIEAPADKDPKRQIWNQIYRKYFIETSPGHFEFHKAPNEKRYLAVDLSETKDITSIGCYHPELDSRGETVVVQDFNIPIKAGKVRISIEASGEFILDLAKIGNIKFAAISFDGYQSSAMKTKIERELEMKITRSKADLDKNVYYTMVSWMQNKKIKCGYSIFLKNNLKSIQEITKDSGNKKIDHSKGALVNEIVHGVDWQTDLRGQNAKDLSDTLSQCVYMLASTYKGIPRYQWKEVVHTQSTEQKKVELLDNIKTKYGLKERVK